VKASSIIMAAGGAVALLLIGLALLLPSTPRGDFARPSEPTAHAPSSPSLPDGDVRPQAAPLASPPMAARKAPEPQGVPPLPSASAPPQPAAAQVVGTRPRSTQGPDDTDVVKRLEVSRRATTEEERIRALHWLADHADPRHFDALQQIQISDPSPEVRKAAEAAVTALLLRHRDSPWPGVTPVDDPQGYMRDVPAPP
jgi:hypothetical protein